MSAEECTCRATTYGLMKMPEPMMPPITIIVASNALRRRARVGMALSLPAEDRVLLAPDLVEPDLESLAHRARFRHGGAPELRRDVDAADADADHRDLSRHELPHRRV